MKAVSEIRKQQSRESRGAKTRDEILQAAVHIASAEGLQGLTIGGLADELNIGRLRQGGCSGKAEDDCQEKCQTHRKPLCDNRYSTADCPATPMLSQHRVTRNLLGSSDTKTPARRWRSRRPCRTGH